MEDNIFIEFCKQKFSYLVEEFGFNDGIIEEDGFRLYIIYEKPGLKLKIVNHSIEIPELPISLYFITITKKFFKKTQEYDFDDLLIYRKCNSQVYEYLDYADINTFYKEISKEKLEFYKDKYSKDEEIKLIIDKYSRLLKDFGSDILKGDLNILQKVKKLREDYDKKYQCGSTYI